MRRGPSLLVLVLGLLSASAAQAVTHDEAVNGDLSGDRLAPTALVLTPGSNTITATSVNGDREYFRLTVPTGFRLVAVNVLSSTSGNVSFLGVQQGDTFTEPPTGTDVAHLYGYAHFGPGNSTVLTDILDDLGRGAGAIGFVPPLHAGNYTFWAQETSVIAATYKLDFVLIKVPAVPLSRWYVGLLAAALVALGAWRLRVRPARG